MQRPLIAGEGVVGGFPGTAGCGPGAAVLLASSTRILVTGTPSPNTGLFAKGGRGQRGRRLALTWGASVVELAGFWEAAPTAWAALPFRARRWVVQRTT